MSQPTFNTLRNYKFGFGFLTICVSVSSIAMAIAVVAVVWAYVQYGSRGYDSIWLIDPRSGEAYRAVRKEGNDRQGREFEYRNHVRMFHSLWFQLDEYTYRDNIKKALNLIGNSGKQLQEYYLRSDALRKMQEDNMSTRYVVDSIRIDMVSVPARGWCFGRQEVTKPGGSSMRRMWTSFVFVDLPQRSEENPHAVKLDNFEIVDRSEITPEQ